MEYVQPRICFWKWAPKFLCDFEIQPEHQISTRWPDLMIVNKQTKKNLQNCRFCVLAVYSKIERKRKGDKYQEY